LSADLERLVAPSIPLDEALRLFARLRTTHHEGTAIERLLARDARHPLPEPLLVAVAAAMIDRAELAGALRALSRAGSNEALLLRADALMQTGDPATAVALVERVLLRDLDWPGARERHARGLDALGVRRPRRAPDPSAATVATSTPDGPYAVLREVARGGAGVVYEAEDRELGRRVALKMFHRPDRDRAQLLHETRVAAALAGPGLVRVFDVDPERGWLAMEWAPLGALRDRLQEPIDAWAPPLARALARVHDAGWVHLDVKPANVLLRAPGDPLLTDFGTARRRGEPCPPGSLGFVSPERLAGRAADPREDVYGFGRVLQEALDAAGPTERGSSAAWRALAGECTSGGDAGPTDGGTLVGRLPGGYVR
jgi:serine/threonine-protein kinase